MNADKIIDILMFRESVDKVENNTPKVTTGSIVWGVLSRSVIIIFLSLIIIGSYDLQKYWWGVFFILWAFVAFPAYTQFKNFSSKIEDLQSSIICGTCRHFEPSGQLCRFYDEHVTEDYIPCDGDNWEPK